MSATAEVRRICLTFPQVTERLSHGNPTFFVRLDGPVDFAEVAGLCQDAYRAVAPKRLVALLDAG